MISREQKIEELLENFHALHRNMVSRKIRSGNIPRITPSQWRIIHLLQQQDELSLKEIAYTLAISSSAATQLIDGLVKDGYVIRKTQIKDRRSIVLTLSKKTKNNMQKMKKYMTQRFMEICTALTDQEFKQYCALNKKMIQGFLSKKV